MALPLPKEGPTQEDRDFVVPSENKDFGEESPSSVEEVAQSQWKDMHAESVARDEERAALKRQLRRAYTDQLFDHYED